MLLISPAFYEIYTPVIFSSSSSSIFLDIINHFFRLNNKQSCSKFFSCRELVHSSLILISMFSHHNIHPSFCIRSAAPGRQLLIHPHVYSFFGLSCQQQRLLALLLFHVFPSMFIELFTADLSLKAATEMFFFRPCKIHSSSLSGFKQRGCSREKHLVLFAQI